MTTPSSRARIDDVARAAGVSITTVSHALNGKGRVNLDTRLRVREIAERLGYTADPIARRLAGGAARLLALSVSTPVSGRYRVMDYEYFHLLINGAAEEALAREYWPVIAPGTAAERFPRIPLDGAIVIDPHRSDPIIRRLRDQGTPFVTTGRQPAATAQGSWVDNDHYDGTWRILDHLAAQGASRIALITTPPDRSYAIDTRRAYEAWCASKGVECLIASARAGLGERTGYAVTRKLLGGANPPDAIHAVLDQLAVGAIVAAHELGVRIPDDLLVSGTTDTSRSRTTLPALTVLDLHPRKIGSTAVGLLIDAIEGRTTGDQHHIVKTTLLKRQSTQRSRQARSKRDVVRPRRS